MTTSLILCRKEYKKGWLSGIKSHGFQNGTTCPGHRDTLPRVWGKVSQNQSFTRYGIKLRGRDLKICYMMNFVAFINSFHLIQVVFKKNY